jgi:phenylpropionate dioxygenase-like ring-hydroxylating dioxygenase large terminal subunit
MLKNFWYAVAFSSEITTKPSRLKVLGQQLVAFRQPRSGRVVVMSDLCVHRGGALSGGWLDEQTDEVVCPYHGWRYDADGVCTKIPANQPGQNIPKKARVDSYPVQEKYRFVWVFLGDLPEAERPPLPDWDEHFDDPSLKAVTGEFLWQANYERVLENGVDIAHTPWVHGGAFGNRDRPEVDEYEPVTTPWSAEATVRLNPPARNVRGLWKWIYRREPQDVVTSTAWFLPNLIRLHVRLPLGDMIIYDTNVPVDETTTLTKFVAFRSFFKGDWADKDALRRTYRIFEQDKVVVEEQRPELLPVDIAGELHMKSDKMSVFYRRRRQELLDQGWGIEAHRITGDVPRTQATVIPSPARKEVPELSRAWVMKEVPVRQVVEQREPAAAGPETDNSEVTMSEEVVREPAP